jgi:nucleoside-diphosphate-sugar epimerase
VAHLAELGHEVVSLARSTAGPPETTLHASHDVGGPTPFPDVGAIDAIAHLAGSSSVIEGREAPERVVRVNTLGTLTTLLYAQRHNARFILFSSQRVYRMGPLALREEQPKKPPDLYGYTKLTAELYVEMAGRLFGVPGVVLRPFSVYGPGQLIQRGTSGVVSIFAQRARAGEPLRVLSRHPKDFVDVSDVAAAVSLALDACQSPARAYNIATGVPTTPLTLAVAVKRLTGSASAITEDYSQDEPGGLVADIDRARRELGYEPRVGLEEGLRRYVRWLSTQP